MLHQFRQPAGPMIDMVVLSARSHASLSGKREPFLLSVSFSGNGALMEYSTQDQQIYGRPETENTSRTLLICFLFLVYFYCLFRYSSPYRVIRQELPAPKVELAPVHEKSTHLLGDLPGVETTIVAHDMAYDMADDMDDLSLELAIALQLKDVEVVMASRKGKGRVGDAITSNDEAAFNDYRRHLEISAQILLDERLARSVDRAVRTDAEELMRVTRAELRDESDRELALRLSEDPATNIVKNNSQWRPLAIGSGIEATDTDMEKWIQKAIEWDIVEPQVYWAPIASGAAII